MMRRQFHSRNEAFTLVELVVVLATASLLALTLLSARAATRSDVIRVACINNLKQVGVAFRKWANSNSGRFPMHIHDYQGGASTAVPTGGSTASGVWRIFQVASNELGSPKIVICPADDRYARTNFLNLYSGGTAPDFKDNTAVSYFIGVDADAATPQMLLSGDRNIGSATTHANSPYGYSPTYNSGGAVSPGTNSALVQWTDKLHVRQGNVLLTDGSVEAVNAERLRELLRRTGDLSRGRYFHIPGATGGNDIILP